MRRLRMEPATISPIRTTIVAAPKPATYFSRRDITVENRTLAADVRPRTYRSCPFDAEARKRGETRRENQEIRSRERPVCASSSAPHCASQHHLRFLWLSGQAFCFSALISAFSASQIGRAHV